ncbi:TPA: hypothetical protein P2N00_000500 [Aeromonas salmonicida]|uniref:hypothetical protein n=1 Tax=Aeromonas salmonicida TaxID=645 RepID=UPI0005BD8BAD|nr:hypothetical protein [Aeromonas salmonicida]OAH88268.1 hypothetical protein AXW79_01415 [Aeromonas salmonicida subsp. salmonicida]OKA78052.1 hypothetical protein BHR41_02460 [Aeromonas salmonicida subsp. salmonicida]SPT73623.1 Uncharacterised protein [Aeromonas salmonicida]HDN9784862.1 hypothetical protein [Aeromonas salmonicida]HDN9789342.1 hypothetical protein [Aeromonas salmonicida]
MKNADMPAMPLVNSNGSPVHHSNAGMENHGVMAGLTKREMMAMHAPEMPDWFDSVWRMRFANNDRYFKSGIDEFGEPVREITKGGLSAMYFAWRTYYADGLLAELEKQNDQ